MRAAKRGNQAKIEDLDPVVLSALNTYAQEICKEKKKAYHSHLQPFPKETVSAEAQEQALDYFSSFTNGYMAVLEELKNDHSIQPSDFMVSEENLAIFEDEEKFARNLEQGKFVYQLLGFTDKMLSSFYEAGFRLLQQKEWAKAKNSFYFLVMIAPSIALFWYCLGYCYEALQQYPQAKDAFEQAIQHDPTRVDNYIGAIRASLTCKDLDRAKLICEKGLELAVQYSDQEWSQPLREMLTEESNRIKNSSRYI